MSARPWQPEPSMMDATHDFFETWKAIASALRRSERWCRYMARRPADPLPVYKVGGIVRLEGEDMLAWLSRQRRAGTSPGSTSFA